MAIDRDLECLGDNEIKAIRKILRDRHETLVDLFLSGADREIALVVETLTLTADATRPSDAKEALASFVGAILRARQLWRDLGQAARVEIGRALSSEAGELNYRMSRGLEPGIDSPDRLGDKLSLIFHDQDVGAAKSVDALLELIARIAGDPDVELAVGELPRYSSRLSEEKAYFLRNIGIVATRHLGLKPAVYEYGDYGNLARVLMTSLYRNLGLGEEPKNFRGDLEAAYRLTV